ncbi:DUF4158 domain-containing protein [Streptomyces sp. NBC_00249]|uniref:DUF4158 domain-containing protein n=1 Tax=Streptomyces sp. NBC_00249 TaxID=2975690 RepID=UPI00339007F7
MPTSRSPTTNSAGTTTPFRSANKFAASPSPGELEQSFRLDAKALEAARSKRAPANRLGWAVQWGCVRMLGVSPPRTCPWSRRRWSVSPPSSWMSVRVSAVGRTRTASAPGAPVAATRRPDGRAPEGGGRTHPRPGRTRRVCRGEPDHGGSRAVVGS